MPSAVKEASEAFLGRRPMSADSLGIGAVQTAGSDSIKTTLTASQGLTLGGLLAAWWLYSITEQDQAIRETASSP